MGTMFSKQITIREIQPEDERWIRELMTSHWGSEISVSRGKIFHPHELPGFIALLGEERAGLVTLHIERRHCEIVTLNSFREGLGIGTALIEAAKSRALEERCRRLWLITTNDNLAALGFYQKRGFSLVAIHRNALELSRSLKPQIPLTGNRGIPLRDEIELEIKLVPASAP